jgi:hypothetical protein
MMYPYGGLQVFLLILLYFDLLPFVYFILVQFLDHISLFEFLLIVDSIGLHFHLVAFVNLNDFLFIELRSLSYFSNLV